ncbi:MAG: hypothetical protein Q4A67_03860 [Aerococcus sp.]|nr:hypothetical protein [Aerococcus sp.]
MAKNKGVLSLLMTLIVLTVIIMVVNYYQWLDVTYIVIGAVIGYGLTLYTYYKKSTQR